MEDSRRIPNMPAYNRQYFAPHLRLGRQTRGLPIERISRAMGWPVAMIERVEAGEVLPTSVELQHMCRWYVLVCESSVLAAETAAGQLDCDRCGEADMTPR